MHPACVLMANRIRKLYVGLLFPLAVANVDVSAAYAWNGELVDGVQGRRGARSSVGRHTSSAYAHDYVKRGLGCWYGDVVHFHGRVVGDYLHCFHGFGGHRGGMYPGSWLKWVLCGSRIIFVFQPQRGGLG